MKWKLVREIWSLSYRGWNCSVRLSEEKCKENEFLLKISRGLGNQNLTVSTFHSALQSDMYFNLSRSSFSLVHRVLTRDTIVSISCMWWKTYRLQNTRFFSQIVEQSRIEGAKPRSCTSRQRSLERLFCIFLSDLLFFFVSDREEESCWETT